MAAGGYWHISKDATGVMTSIIANENTTGDFYVQVEKGQFLKLSGATISQ